MIWVQSLDGRAIDVLDPNPDDVDFVEIARTLARINRYSGASAVPVSVALHTIIACDATDEADKPWVLLHDAHEARIGDITTPVRQALSKLGAAFGETAGGTPVDLALKTLAQRHDVAIHLAAGLAMPTRRQRQAIRTADLIALQTERRAFLAAPPMAWAPEVENHAPLASWTPAISRAWSDMKPDEVAGALATLFKHYLPARSLRAKRDPVVV